MADEVKIKTMSVNLNRLGNTHNKHQGKFKRVLCVCSAGLLRSPTIAWILSNEPYNCNTRSCGGNKEYAFIPIDEAMVLWADVIVCADASHKPFIESAIADYNKLVGEEDFIKREIICLNIDDIHGYRSPALISEIKTKLELFPTFKEGREQ